MIISSCNQRPANCHVTRWRYYYYYYYYTYAMEV